MGVYSQQNSQNFAFPMRKSTPAVLTNLSYEQHLKKFVEISPSLFLLLHTINMRIRVAQADEALPFHRIPHDAPTSAICYIAVCSAQYTL